MLEYDWRLLLLKGAIIFRETHSERSSRQLSTAFQFRITSQMISKALTTAIQPKPTRHCPNKCSKQWDTDHFIPITKSLFMRKINLKIH